MSKPTAFASAAGPRDEFVRVCDAVDARVASASPAPVRIASAG